MVPESVHGPQARRWAFPVIPISSFPDMCVCVCVFPAHKSLGHNLGGGWVLGKNLLFNLILCKAIRGGVTFSSST